MNKEVFRLNEDDTKEYINFISEVFGYVPSEEDINLMMKNEMVLGIKNENRIIAAISVERKREFIKGLNYYRISYLGVLKQYRRMGYATRLFNEVERLAAENNINYLELTSGNQRKSAHFFYQKNDFKIKDTTVFVKLY